MTLTCIVLLQDTGELAGLQRKGNRLQELRVSTRQVATPGEQIMSPINLEEMEIFQHSDSGDTFAALVHREKGPRSAAGGPGGGSYLGYLVQVAAQAALPGLGATGGGPQLAKGLCCSSLGQLAEEGNSSLLCRAAWGRLLGSHGLEWHDTVLAQSTANCCRPE